MRLRLHFVSGKIPQHPSKPSTSHASAPNGTASSVSVGSRHNRGACRKQYRGHPIQHQPRYISTFFFTINTSAVLIAGGFSLTCFGQGTKSFWYLLHCLSGSSLRSLGVRYDRANEICNYRRRRSVGTLARMVYSGRPSLGCRMCKSRRIRV